MYLSLDSMSLCGLHTVTLITMSDVQQKIESVIDKSVRDMLEVLIDLLKKLGAITYE